MPPAGAAGSGAGMSQTRLSVVRTIAAMEAASVSYTHLDVYKRQDLRRPIYRRTATFGHFGDPSMPWEQLDMVEAIQNACK